MFYSTPPLQKLIESLKSQSQRHLNATQSEGQAVPACPTFFADPALQILTEGFSNINNFKDVELSPFLQVRFPSSPGNVQVREVSSEIGNAHK